LQSAIFLTSLLARHPLLILDQHGRIIVAFAGAPEDPEWPEVVAKAIEALKEARKRGLRTRAFAEGDSRHRRGNYLTLATGISHGGGQKVPY
jgi:hypothetical protein